VLAAGSRAPCPLDSTMRERERRRSELGRGGGTVFVSVWRGRRAWCFCRGETSSVFLS
jgi:hypothetical protein